MTRIIVVGGGIVGIRSASSLAETGASVAMIERQAPGQGASAGNAGIISPWSIIPQSTPGLWKQISGLQMKKYGPLSLQYDTLHRIIPWGRRFLAQGRRRRFLHTVQQMETLTRDCPSLYRSMLAGTVQESLMADSYYVHAFRQQYKVDPDCLRRWVTGCR